MRYFTFSTVKTFLATASLVVGFAAIASLALAPSLPVLAEATSTTEVVPSVEGTPDTPLATCADAETTELLPNPAGADTGKEFIELHNPTATPLSLQGCALTTSANAKTYAFDADAILQPDEYHAYSDTVTKLTLANAAGGTVTLSQADETILQQVTYPENLDDDQAWALLDNTWQSVALPSPNAANVADPIPEQENDETLNTAPINTPDPVTSFVPCKEGQERNPATNRCRLVASATGVSSLVPCRAGQTRNPATNRCRNSASLAASAGLTPCKAGQIRNPETNRCKAAASLTSSLQPCQAGQVRNPATNRCKKTAGDITGAGSVKDVKAASTENNSVRWILILLAIASALVYAAYEWRQEIAAKLGMRASTFKLPRLNIRRPKSLKSETSTSS